MLITVLVFSVSPTQSCYTTTWTRQFCNEPKLKPSWGSSFLPSESFLLVEKWVTSTLKVIVGRHKKRCYAGTLDALWGTFAYQMLELLLQAGPKQRVYLWWLPSLCWSPQGNSIDQRCEQHTSVKPVYTQILQPGVCLTNVFKHVRNVTHLCLCVSLCACAWLHIWVPPWRGVLDESSSNLCRLLLPMFWTCRLSESCI